MTGVLHDIAGLAPQAHEAADDAWAGVGGPGAWWTGAARVAIAEVARAATPPPVGSPYPSLAELSNEAGSGPISPVATLVASRVAVGAGSLTRADVRALVEVLGDAPYAELCSVVCQVVAIDHLRAAMGAAPAPLPAPRAGEPSGTRPEGLVDIGGHIVMHPEAAGHNISRSLTLAGDDHRRWLMLVFTMYAGAGFDQMVWPDHALSRPQVEFLAARTSALNECFY